MTSAQLIVPSDFQHSPIQNFSQLRWLALAALALLVACANHDPLIQLADEHALQRSIVQSGHFTLTTLGKPLPQTVDKLRVYIGGDGRPWRGREPAGNPTGTRSLAVKLMVQDPLPAIYLGRPCYHAAAMTAPCAPRLWTSGRYSETVIATMVRALNELVERHQVRQLTLVGYSGGGAIALLCATRLTAAGLNLMVITVASNLDTRHWTEFHHLLPLSESLNPLEVVPSPAPFRQLHLAGRADRVVPESTIQRYVETHPDATVLYVDDFDHTCCWALQWRQLLATIDTRFNAPIPSPGAP